MQSVTLDTKEWNLVLAALSQGPWQQVNPVIMKIGDQLRMQTVQDQEPRAGNGKQTPEEIQRTLDESAPIQRRPI